MVGFAGTPRPRPSVSLGLARWRRGRDRSEPPAVAASRGRWRFVIYFSFFCDRSAADALRENRRHGARGSGGETAGRSAPASRPGRRCGGGSARPRGRGAGLPAPLDRARPDRADARGPAFRKAARRRGGRPRLVSVPKRPGSSRRARCAVAVAQIDTTVGDFAGNAREDRRPRAAGPRRRAPTSSSFRSSPSAVIRRGTCVERRVLRPRAASGRPAASRALRGDAVWVFGSLLRNPAATGRRVFNVADRGPARTPSSAIYRKRLLPTYDVFDEGRYFEPGDRPARPAGRAAPRRAHDLRGHLERQDLLEAPALSGRPGRRAEALESRPPRQHLRLPLDSLGKDRLRRAHDAPDREAGPGSRSSTATSSAATTASSSTAPRSAFDARGRLVGRGRRFEEDFWILDVPGGTRLRLAAPEPGDPRSFAAPSCSPCPTTRRSAASRAPCSGSRAGSTRRSPPPSRSRRWARNASSGSRCRGPYSSEGSLRDARDARRAARRSVFSSIPITPVLDAYRATLARSSAGRVASRPRRTSRRGSAGAILMALSNRYGHLVLSTGNKSELAVGYCTLYGDMAGGYAVLSDVPKTLVYELAAELNRDGERIPRATLEKPPSAELRPEPEGHRLPAPLREARPAHRGARGPRRFPSPQAARRRGCLAGPGAGDRAAHRRRPSTSGARCPRARRSPPGPSARAAAIRSRRSTVSERGRREVRLEGDPRLLPRPAAPPDPRPAPRTAAARPGRGGRASRTGGPRPLRLSGGRRARRGAPGLLPRGLRRLAGRATRSRRDPGRSPSTSSSARTFWSTCRARRSSSRGSARGSRPGGVLLVSLPNVANVTVRAGPPRRPLLATPTAASSTARTCGSTRGARPGS